MRNKFSKRPSSELLQMSSKFYYVPFAFTTPPPPPPPLALNKCLDLFAVAVGLLLRATDDSSCFSSNNTKITVCANFNFNSVMLNMMTPP